MENGLLKKMYFKPGFKVLIANAPNDAAAILGDTSSIEITKDEADVYQGMLLFVKNSTELLQALATYGSKIKDQIVWFAYPKKNAGIDTDLKMEQWKELDSYKLTPCASAAINDVWTGLRIKPVDAVKASGVGNKEIKSSAFSEYIDVSNKKVTAPPELAELLNQYPKEQEFFNSLAYSHKKEYVLWILTAKQEQTKANRLQKTIEMLKAGKKNPNMK
jgi:hypothetical protein